MCNAGGWVGGVACSDGRLRGWGRGSGGRGFGTETTSVCSEEGVIVINDPVICGLGFGKVLQETPEPSHSHRGDSLRSRHVTSV